MSENLRFFLMLLGLWFLAQAAALFYGGKNIAKEISLVFGIKLLLVYVIFVVLAD